MSAIEQQQQVEQTDIDQQQPQQQQQQEPQPQQQQQIPEQQQDSTPITQIRFLVNKTAVGSLIGQQGRNIKAVAQQTTANVHVEPFVTNFQDLQEAIKERILSVRFTTPEVLGQVITAVAPTLRRARELAFTTLGRTVAEDEHVFKGLLHTVPVQELLTNHGELLKQIQQNTGCNVKISHRLPFSSESPIIFKGTLAQIVAAIQETLPFFQNHSGEGQLQYRPYQLTAPVQQNAQINERGVRIPACAVGAVIGKGGSKLKEITKLTSCYVSIDRTVDYNPNLKYSKALLNVKGPTKNIPLCVSMIFAAVGPAVQREENLKNQAQGGQQQPQQQQQQQQQQPPHHNNGGIPNGNQPNPQQMLQQQPQYQPQQHMGAAYHANKPYYNNNGNFPYPGNPQQQPQQGQQQHQQQQGQQQQPQQGQQQPQQQQAPQNFQAFNPQQQPQPQNFAPALQQQ